MGWWWWWGGGGGGGLLSECTRARSNKKSYPEAVRPRDLTYYSHKPVMPLNSLRPVHLTIIGSDDGLSSGRRQAITWNDAGILLVRTLGTNFSEILCEIHTFLFKKNAFEFVIRKLSGNVVKDRWTLGLWRATSHLLTSASWNLFF